jgi:hypothetical protein
MAKVARTRALEEESGLALESTGQVLGCRPSRLRGWAIEPTPPTEPHDVVAFDQGQARSQSDPCVGDGERDCGTSPRPHPGRRGAAVHRGEQASVGAGPHQAHCRPARYPAATSMPSWARLRRFRPVETTFGAHIRALNRPGAVGGLGVLHIQPSFPNEIVNRSIPSRYKPVTDEAQDGPRS